MNADDRETSALVAVEPTWLNGAMRREWMQPTALALPDGLDFEDWSAVGRWLQAVEGSVHWWLGDWWNYGERSYGEMASQEAKDAVEDATGYAYETLRKDGWIAERFENVRRRTNLSWSHHQEVAELPEDEQDEWLDVAEHQALSRNELRRAVREAKRGTAIDLPMIAGSYHVLLADPPWRYDFAETTNRAIENQYPTMPVEDIAALAVPAADDAVLFLWATNPKLCEALTVIDGWGFTYVTNLVWVKDKIGMGYYARSRHELLLVARRGDMPVPEPADRPDSVIEAPRTEHSVKPGEVYEVIERMYPDVAKVELFARNEREGWVPWGNEVTS